MRYFDEAYFRARLRDRALELGKSERKLLTEAGLSHELIDQTPAHGRRIDTLERVAEAFGLSLLELLGLPPATVALDLMQVATGVGRRMLAQAGLAAEDDEQVSLAVRIYEILANRRRSGQPINDGFLAGIEETLRFELTSRRAM